MNVFAMSDRRILERSLRQNIYLNLYSIGDLDDFFWPWTRWYGIGAEHDPDAVALVYRGIEPPTVLALDEEPEPMGELLGELAPDLPDRFYGHLSPGLAAALARDFSVVAHGEHYKMALHTLDEVAGVDCSAATRLSRGDAEELRSFYARAYPDNWFDPRMLETGQYFGIRSDDGLVAVAGIHVYSPTYRVAALGNITTLPEYRGYGLARTVTAATCRSLAATVDHIGLNVKADNEAAVGLYRSLGFEVVASYGEFTFERRR